MRSGVEAYYDVWNGRVLDAGKMLDGVARKIAFVLVFVSACGWIVFVTGFGIRNAEDGSVLHSYYTSHWILSLWGLVVHFIFFLHLLCGNRISSVITLSVVPLYLAMAGAVLQFDSRNNTCGGSFPSLLHQKDFELHVLIEYIGVLLSGATMWLTLALWPLLKYSAAPRDDYTPINT